MAYDKVVDSAVLDAKLGDIADAIRGKTGGTDPLTLEQMVTEIEGISAGGGGDSLDAFLDGSMSGVYENVDLTSVKPYAFAHLTGLTKISLPGVTTAKDFAFVGCTNLEELEISNLRVGGKQMFNACSKITNILLPNLTEVAVQMFQGSLMTVIDLPSVQLINPQAFNSNPITTVILRYSAVVSLKNTSAFSSTRVTSGDVKVYVPSVLVDSYRTATNWSAFYAQNNNFIQPIEGSEYE